MCVHCENELSKAEWAGVLIDSGPSRVKFFRDLEDELTAYVSTVILNVFNAVARNLGVEDPNKLAAKPPRTLQKGFLDGLRHIANRARGWFGRRRPVEPLVIKGKPLYVKGKPVTTADWARYEKQITEYMKPYLATANEEMAVKALLFAMSVHHAESQGEDAKRFGRKGYEQVEREWYGGYIPDTIEDAEARYRMPKAVRAAYDREMLRSAQYVQKVDENVRTAIQRQVVKAVQEGLTDKQLASNLYWMHAEDPEMKRVYSNPDTAEQLIRDWHRVAVTELAMIHESGKMAAMEDQAEASMAGKADPVYVVFGGSGRCKWCGPRQGTVARMVPMSMIGDTMDDSLDSRGIKDPNTNIAVWQGKSNVGYRQAQWRICCPAHPWCRCTYTRFFPGKQRYDEKTFEITNNDDAKFGGKAQDDFWAELERENGAAVLARDLRVKERNKRRGYAL